MGILQNSNRSTIDSAEYLLNKNVLADYLRMFERVINSQLLWEDYDKERKFVLHHENNIAEDIAQKLQIANDGLSRGVLTVNDWRIAMGYEADESGAVMFIYGASDRLKFLLIQSRLNCPKVNLHKLLNFQKKTQTKAKKN